MSKQIEQELKMLSRRGVPESDPRVRGLKRRQEAERVAEREAVNVTHTLRKGLKELLKGND